MLLWTNFKERNKKYMSFITSSLPKLPRLLRIAASVAAVPVLSVLGVFMMMLAWFLFLLKTSPQGPIHLDRLVFMPATNGCIVCHLPELKFPENSRVRLDLKLRWPDRPDLSLITSAPYLIRGDVGLEQPVLFNFLPTFRSPMVRHLRAFLRLPLYFLLWKREDEGHIFHTPFMQIKPREKAPILEVCPALPLYESSLTVFFEPKGITKFIHDWPIIWTGAYLIFAIIVSVLLGIFLSILPWFIFGKFDADAEDEELSESDNEEEIGLNELFNQDRIISSGLLRKRNLSPL